MERDWRISVGGTSHVRSFLRHMMGWKGRRVEAVASRNPFGTCTKGFCSEWSEHHGRDCEYWQSADPTLLA